MYDVCKCIMFGPTRGAKKKKKKERKKKKGRDCSHLNHDL